MESSDWVGPLAGVKVLDFTRVLAGPFATLLLSDLGAEILKVEPPGKGDDIRTMAPFIGGESHYFISTSRGKKGLVIDLKHPRGRAIALELAQQVDVVVENYRPGVMDSLGLGYETLSAINPKLIYCSISGFGATGPLRDKPSFDIVTQALSGAISINGGADAPPEKLGLPFGDLAGGIYGSIAILGALHERHATGRGRLIDVSLLDGMMGLLGYYAQIYFVTGNNPPRVGSKHINITPYGIYPTSDGHIIVACLVERFWVNFAKALGREDFLEDPRFKDYQSRLDNREALDTEINALMRQRTKVQWEKILEECDVPHAGILSIGEALEQPHAKAREMVVTVEHPRAGPIRMVGRSIKYPGAPQKPLEPPPTLGQHTRQVLSEFLGYVPETLNELEREGVIDRIG
jgi:crotonobetainyl-CoA:carnitine CoA-transferase CaiB-like acyl-CoA transferase